MRMRTLSSFGASSVVVLAVMLGCVGNSSCGYEPDTVNATLAGLPADRTLIPQERPQEAIEATSYGRTPG